MGWGVVGRLHKNRTVAPEKIRAETILCLRVALGYVVCLELASLLSYFLFSPRALHRTLVSDKIRREGGVSV